jgi:hypothetical protein
MYGKRTGAFCYCQSHSQTWTNTLAYYEVRALQILWCRPQARLGGGVVFQLGRGHFDCVLVLPRVLGNVC